MQFAWLQQTEERPGGLGNSRRCGALQNTGRRAQARRLLTQRAGCSTVHSMADGFNMRRRCRQCTKPRAQRDAAAQRDGSRGGGSSQTCRLHAWPRI